MSKKKKGETPPSRKKPGQPSKPDDVESDERVIRVRERFSRAEARMKMFDRLSVDIESKLKEERKGPRPVLSNIEREIHRVERDWNASQRKLEDLKMQSRIRKVEIAKAEEEFRQQIHKDVDLEHPAELDPAQLESAKKMLEEKVKRITEAIGKYEQEIPVLIQEELAQRGRLEHLRIERESIKSGFRDLPIEKDPRMTSFLKEQRKQKKEYKDLKVEMEATISKVKGERGQQPKRPTDRSPRGKGDN